MDELVKMSVAVIGGEKVNAVDARELWKFLGSRQDFSTWIKDRLKGFIPEQDFTVHKIVDGRNRGRFTPIEYTITLDVAKHLAMLERNEQGYKVRQYFIEVENGFTRINLKLHAEEETELNGSGPPTANCRSTHARQASICDCGTATDASAFFAESETARPHDASKIRKTRFLNINLFY